MIKKNPNTLPPKRGVFFTVGKCSPCARSNQTIGCLRLAFLRAVLSYLRRAKCKKCLTILTKFWLWNIVINNNSVKFCESTKFARKKPAQVKMCTNGL